MIWVNVFFFHNNRYKTRRCGIQIPGNLCCIFAFRENLWSSEGFPVWLKSGNNLDGSLVLWLSPLALPVLFSWCSSFHSLQNNSIFQIQKVMTPTACIFISFYVYIVYVQVCVSQEKLERSESYLNLSVLYFPCKQSYSCIGTTGDTIYTKGVKYNYL